MDENMGGLCEFLKHENYIVRPNFEFIVGSRLTTPANKSYINIIISNAAVY